MTILNVLFVTLSLTAPLWSSAQVSGRGERPRDLLLAVNQGDDDLSVIDLNSGVQVSRIQEGAVTGHEVATSEDGRLAFIPIYGNSTPGKPGTDGDQVAVLDIAQQKVTRRVFFPHGVRPHCIIRNPKDGLFYVTTELDQTVSIIDPRTFTVVGSIPTGRPQSHMLALSHDGRFAYTANIDTGTVSVLDLVTRRLVGVIPVAGEIQRISISADDTKIFTADQKNARMAVIDALQQRVTTWVDLPGVGYGSTSTLDGHYLLVTLPKLSQIAVVNLRKFQVVKTFSTPSGPHEVAVDKTGKVAFVACTTASKVARVDLTRWTITAEFPVGAVSDGIGLDRTALAF